MIDRCCTRDVRHASASAKIQRPARSGHMKGATDLFAVGRALRAGAKPSRDGQRQKRPRKLTGLLAIAAILATFAWPAAAQAPLPAPPERQRMIVLSDIEADPD